ncbi:MAG: hypothetical protein ACFFFH_11155 [Candidatus Thorarchaeota archaeon]
MGKTSYRSANMIILSILEILIKSIEKLRNEEDGVLKSHIIQKCSLKSTTAEKYLSKMEKANYITSFTDYWGERELIKYKITPRGKERYSWFVRINAELE